MRRGLYHVSVLFSLHEYSRGAVSDLHRLNAPRVTRVNYRIGFLLTLPPALFMTKKYLCTLYAQIKVFPRYILILLRFFMQKILYSGLFMQKIFVGLSVRVTPPTPLSTRRAARWGKSLHSCSLPYEQAHRLPLSSLLFFSILLLICREGVAPLM